MPNVYHLAPSARRAIMEAITSALAGREDVEFAYAYGSFLGDAPFRDIDVAIWAAPTADRRLDLDLAVQLTRACHYPVDVRLVNHAPVAFLFHVFRGEALLVRNERRLADLIEGTARTYHDVAPLLRQAVRDAFASTSMVACVLATALAAAQEAVPAFEVASVRQNVSSSGGSSSNIRPGGFYTVTNVPLVDIVRFAYGILEAQIVGGPDWMRTSRFDVAARASGDVPSEQIPLMVRSLLQERFGLRAKRERREMPILELVLARSDGRIGPNLRPCSSSADNPRGLPSTTERFEIPQGSTSGISGACSPLSALADLASKQLQAIVVDRTALVGEYRYRLGFGPELPEGGAALAPSFTVALREQLGLRLERARGMVDVLVVESVQQPTEN